MEESNYEEAVKGVEKYANDLFLYSIYFFCVKWRDTHHPIKHHRHVVFPGFL